MDTRKKQAKYPDRVSAQLPNDLKSQLIELARREYGGSLQALIRATLQARVEGGGTKPDFTSAVIQALDTVGQDIARQDRDIQGGLNHLLEQGEQLREAAGVQNTDIPAAHDKLSMLTSTVATHSDVIIRLIAVIDYQSGVIHQMVERVVDQSDRITNLSEQVAEQHVPPPRKPRSLFGF